MDFLTGTIYHLFKRRLTVIDQWKNNSGYIQEIQLERLLRLAKDTAFGMRYDFKSIKTYDDFVARVPIATYDDLKEDIMRMLRGEKNILWQGQTKWFAKSSGTTEDKSKFIPVTPDVLSKCHYQGGKDVVWSYLRNRPDSRLFSGKGLILGGSHAPTKENSNAHSGDLSAVLLQNLYAIVDCVRVPSRKTILMDEWEAKLKRIVEETKDKSVTNLSGVPSWMLVLLKRILKETGKRDLCEVWPELEVFFHGGISFEPYRNQYKSIISSSRMHYVETYNASEGFFAYQDDPNDPSMLLMLDYGTFYEFIPMDELRKENPKALPLTEVELGKNYAMIISTMGGLWRYLIGDTVIFTSKDPYKIKISGRTKHFINAFGEELMVHNAEKALVEACQITGAEVKEYTVAPKFFLDKAQGCHQWIIEFNRKPKDVEAFADVLDETLQRVNSDYEAKRYKNISLRRLDLFVAKEGLFYEWLSRNGKLGGQHKIPRLSNERVIFDQLLSLNEECFSNDVKR